MQIRKVQFTRPSKADFHSTLKKRVHMYFKDNNLSKAGDWRMWIKTAFMLSLYLTPFFLMIGGVVTGFWPVFAMWILMGFGMAGIGLSIMHDANHRSYSENEKVNNFIGAAAMLVVGGCDNNWRIQHNVLHHTYTNIDELDEDIDTVPFLRFTPRAKYLPVHKFQFLYAWFFYGLMTLLWSTTKDFEQLIRYRKKDLTKTLGKSFGYLFRRLLVFKLAYYLFVVVIPFMVVDLPWWQILIGYISMHFVAGLTLACIFQPAHVMPNTEFPEPDHGGTMENTWAVHQMLTTTNFAAKSRMFSWFVGGLNYQVEHHLFPTICHIHYRKLSKIVKETAQEFNIPYHSLPTFRGALIAHGKMLWKLGRVA